MTTAVSGTKRLLLATSDPRALLQLREPLISETIRRRHKVVVLAPAPDQSAAETLAKIGATMIVAPLEPRGFNPLQSFSLRRGLTQHLKTIAPHTVACCDSIAARTMGPVARVAGVARVVAMLPRLPLDDDAISAADKGLRQRLTAFTTIVVETQEERRRLAMADWLGEPSPTLVVAPTAGIDGAQFGVIDLPPLQDGFVFALVTSDDEAARRLFLKAADLLRERAPKARFTVAGEHGGTSELRAMIATAHAVVHASSRDGLSRGLLHGLAAGRPVITTDVAASRDTVDERVNGCRVPAGDAAALADAMASFLKRSDLMPAMARASRLKALRRYDLAAVNDLTLDALGLDAGFAAVA